MALASERRPAPAFAGVALPARASLPAPTIGASLANQRALIFRRFGLAARIAAGGLLLAAVLPAIAAAAMHVRGGGSAPAQAAAFGPGTELRAAAAAATGWERSHSAAAPSAGELGFAIMAGAEQQRLIDEALRTLAAEMQAKEAAARAVARPSGQPYSVNAASGYAVGTVLRARITIYGCTGPGGGFCGGMASGGRVFEGAAACSRDLPFGTKLRVIGDPTGRVYECLDRGALAATWVDVFFNNTADGVAWQRALGTTVANIEIVN
jgi:hypothetical protein